MEWRYTQKKKKQALEGNDFLISCSLKAKGQPIINLLTINLCIDNRKTSTINQPTKCPSSIYKTRFQNKESQFRRNAVQMTSNYTQ